MNPKKRQKTVADLQKTAAKFADQKDKIGFLTISIDGEGEPAALVKPTIDKVTPHLNQKGWSQTTNGWSGFEALKGWRISGVPTTYIIGADGKIITNDREKEIEELIAPLLAKRSHRSPG